MAVCGIEPTEMTSAELFEDFHRRMGLRNRISNAMMAIALQEVGSTSPNLPKYSVDGLKLCQEFLKGLRFIKKHLPDFYWQDYPTKVLSDILTNRQRNQPDMAELKELEQKIESALRVFEAISRGEFNKEQTLEAKEMLMELDREIEAIYVVEEQLYRYRYFPWR